MVEAVATIAIEERDIVVGLQKRADTPLVLAATDIAVPWLGGKRLRFVLG